MSLNFLRRLLFNEGREKHIQGMKDDTNQEMADIAKKIRKMNTLLKKNVTFDIARAAGRKS